MEAITAKLNNFIIHKKIEALSDQVIYYKSKYLPDIYEYTGQSQGQHLQYAEEKLKEFKRDVNDYKQNKRFDLLDITKQEMAQFTRLFVADSYDLACDFSHNPLITGPALREAILAIQELKKLLPELEIFSNRTIANRHIIIKLKN
jgi:hypothetical protein